MIEEADKTTLLMVVKHLKFYLLTLGILNEDQTQPQRKLKAQRQSSAYIMGDASGLGFGSVLWGQGKLVS